ncbi:MAG: alkaline phosphatase family protein [Bacteroidetes bacterium]|nr:MAG: alkaline phosphatase family protein [Bacteroidota bacterium]
MKKWFAVLCFSIFILSGYAQQTINRPKLVLGIVVDQMRWDYLYRFYDRYGNGGFRRLLQEGYSFENTMINYVPSFTAVGHSCIFTGSVPAINGITSNEWIDQLTGTRVYCTGDSSVQSLGAENAEDGRMSPRNLLVTTVTDELRMATNFQSKVVGVSLKDRAAILPAGHSANGAFWLDDASGNFISSSYYMKELPSWVYKFNEQKRILSLIKNDWNTLYPINTYKQSDPDNNPYEGRLPGENAPVFPHRIKDLYQKSPGVFRTTPFGNTLTLEFAARVIDGYQLGQGPATDFLTINCASTDYVGHMFGPNSVEIEDTYLRLDQDLAKFFSLLDDKIGKGQWLVFLTADHGAAHSIGFMQKHNLPGELFTAQYLVDDLNRALNSKFGDPKLILSGLNYQLNFDLRKINDKHLDFDAIKRTTIDLLLRERSVNNAVDLSRIAESNLPEPIKTMVTNGYYFKRSGSVQVIYHSGWLESYARTGTTHGTWNPYDAHIPLIFMGWNIAQGKSNHLVHMTDIAPTIAALLHIQMPSGCIGVPITEVLK